MWLATVFSVLVAFSPVARAEGVEDQLRQALGGAIDSVLTDEDWESLQGACPQEDAESILACWQSNEDAKAVLEAARMRALEGLAESLGEGVVDKHADALLAMSQADLEQLGESCNSAEDPTACIEAAFATEGDEGAVAEGGEEGESEGEAAEGGEEGEGEGEAAEGGDAGQGEAAGGEQAFPPEALALLPQEVLEALPKAITAFLQPADYAALKEACPQGELEQVIECLDTPDVTKLLETLHTRGVVSSLLTYMDQELPNRLGPEELDALADGCTEPGEKWADCVFTKGLESDECFETEDALASCLIDDDDVTAVYLQIQAEKKEVFGPDLYVQFRGLMSQMTLDMIREVRAQCPQTEQEPLYECLGTNETVDEMVQVFAMATEELMKEVQSELTAAGHPLDDAQIEQFSERVLNILLSFPLRAIDSLSKECSAKNPAFDNPTNADDLSGMLDCIEQASDTDPVANPAFISPERLRSWLVIAREKVNTVLRAKEEAAQARSMSMILTILGVVAGIGFFVVLLMPLKLGKQYPDRKGELWRASAIAAVTFVITVALLGGTLIAMRTVQGKVATESTSPKMVVANGVFDVLEKDEYVEGLSGMSRERLDFIKTPLRKVIESSGIAEDAQELVFGAFVAEHWVDQLKEPELRHLAKNVQMIERHVANFKSVFGFYRRIDWVMGYVPLVLSLLAVILYMIPLKDTLVHVATAPVRAAKGEKEGMVARAGATVLAEVKLLLPFLLVMALFLLVTGVFLSIAVEPLIEVLMSFSFMTVLYILLTEASGFVLYASLGSSVLLLAFGIAIYIVVMVFYVGTMRKILRAIFHWGHPASRYTRFWTIGSALSIAVMLFPVLFAMALRYWAMEHVMPNVDVENGNITAKDMLVVPLGGLIVMPILLWATRCFKALGWVKKFPVVKDPTPPAA